MRRLASLVVLLCALTVQAAEGDTFERLRGWTQTALASELERADPDLNMLASVLYVVVNDLRVTGDPASGELLLSLDRRVRALDPAALDCPGISDVFMIMAILQLAGLDSPENMPLERLRDCLDASLLFDVANALIFVCGHTSWSHEEVLPGKLERLRAVQRRDGAFVAETGREWFYLTTHGMLALHLCGGDREGVERTRARLEDRLGLLKRNGMLDGLAEALMFLRLTGGPARDEAHYLEWLLMQIQPDGGLCLRQLPECEPHWHSTAMLYQLVLETGTYGPGTPAG